MLNFLENHDEQRFASPQYAGDADKVLPSLIVSAMINTGPMMIYAGQELGEPGTDAEGYSGYDGRTTIFDYWSIASLRRWLNGGTCDGELYPAALRLREMYRRVLTLCNSEPAISHGRFFDLMYVNYDNPGLDPHRDYAFIRATADELLLIIVNFADQDKDIALNIPEHAFDILDYPQGIANACELLDDIKEKNKSLAADRPFTTKVPAHGAVVWKIKKKDIKDCVSDIKPAEAKAVAKKSAVKQTSKAKKS